MLARGGDHVAAFELHIDSRAELSANTLRRESFEEQVSTIGPCDGLYRSG
jgi:hypothetical protein